MTATCAPGPRAVRAKPVQAGTHPKTKTTGTQQGTPSRARGNLSLRSSGDQGVTVLLPGERRFRVPPRRRPVTGTAPAPPHHPPREGAPAPPGTTPRSANPLPARFRVRNAGTSRPRTRCSATRAERCPGTRAARGPSTRNRPWAKRRGITTRSGSRQEPQRGNPASSKNRRKRNSRQATYIKTRNEPRHDPHWPWPEDPKGGKGRQPPGQPTPTNPATAHAARLLRPRAPAARACACATAPSRTPPWTRAAGGSYRSPGRSVSPWATPPKFTRVKISSSSARVLNLPVFTPMASLEKNSRAGADRPAHRT